MLKLRAAPQTGFWRPLQTSNSNAKLENDEMGRGHCSGSVLKVLFTPGFSPVQALRTVRNRFNGFSFCKPDGKPLKRFLEYRSHPGTGLKPRCE